MDEASRAKDIQRAVVGDSDALQRLIVNYHDILWQKVDAELNGTLERHLEADDVLQIAYVAAFQAIGQCQFDGPAGFYSWLEAIALQKLKTANRDLHRQKRDVSRERHADSLGRAASSRSSYPDLFAGLAADQSTPSRQLASQEAAAAVISSLARLSDDQRAVIRMRFLEDWPVSQIAAELGKSEDAVYMLCHRGLKALQEHMGSISRYFATA